MDTSNKMIDEILLYVTKGSYVLEPSAGGGKLACQLIEQKGCKVDCVELNSDCSRFLESTGFFNKVIHGDFLKQTFFDKEVYDFVVAVPPYKNNIDCQHIMAMYDVVKPGGKVLSFTLPYWVTGIHENQVQFRKWLSDKDFKIKFFEDDKSYVSCPKALLIIRK